MPKRISARRPSVPSRGALFRLPATLAWMLAGLVAGGAAAAVAATDPPWPAGSWTPGFHIPGVQSGQINAFCEYQGDLVVAGTFRGLGGVGVRRVARWDGERWHPLGRGVDAEVRVLCVYHDDLIAAGSFRTAGDSAVGHVARWDGSRWHSLGAGLDGAVNALAVCQDTLFVGGWFEHAGGAPAFRLASPCFHPPGCASPARSILGGGA